MQGDDTSSLKVTRHIIHLRHGILGLLQFQFPKVSVFSRRRSLGENCDLRATGLQ